MPLSLTNSSSALLTAFNEEATISHFANLIFFFETVVLVSSAFQLKDERKSILEAMFYQEQNIK